MRSMVIGATALLAFSGLVAQGEGRQVIAFEDLAKLAEENSGRIRAAQGEARAAELSRDRLRLHWAPRIYVEGRAFRTNDSGIAFGSRLSERSVRTEDLSLPATPLELVQNPANILRPDTLNHPAPSNHGSGALGFEWMLYEGGAGQATARAAERSALAAQMQTRSLLLVEYAGLAIAYSDLIILERERREVAQLRTTARRLLGAYQLGGANNPVGRAGLLALRAYDNRLQARLVEQEALIARARNSIVAAAGDLSPGWQAASDDPLAFADRSLIVPEQGSDTPPSYMLQAVTAQADAAELGADAQDAVLRPRAGIFGEARYNAGDRGGSDNYIIGFFVRMNLYSPIETGASEETRTRANAARELARDAARREQATRESNRVALASIRQSLALVKESQRLLAEQGVTAQRLYRDGAISALQLAETQSRRADALFDQTRAEREYVRLRAAIFLINGADLLSAGVSE